MFLVLFLNLISTFLICLIFKNLIIFFVIFFAIIVLDCEILSLFQAFNSNNIILISFLNLIISFLFWFIYSKKLYLPKFPKEIKQALKQDKSLRILSIFFILMLLTTGFLALYSLPLEADSRMYHFSRIFEYIKQQSFLHFDTNEVRNIILPINSEMFYSYFYIFKKNEFGFGLLSYFSFIWLIFGLYGIFRELKVPVKKTLFSIFVFSSFGIIIAQIPFLQTDLIISCLSIISLYLFIKNKFYLSGLSYALALGVKTTAIINFISFFIIILSYTLIFKKDIKNIFKYLIFLFLNFCIFSAYNYILNFIQFGNFLYNKALYAEHYLNFNIDSLIFNSKNLLKDLFIFQNDIVLDERKIGLSFQGVFIFIPCLIYSFFKLNNKRNLFIGICSFVFIINFLILSSCFVYSQYLIRYFLGFLAFSSFCLIYPYHNKIFKNLITSISVLYLLIFPFLIFKFPINTFLEEKSFKYEKLKENIILKKQKGLAPYIQYIFLKEFTKEFSQNDKIAILNHDNFYEIKQFKNFNWQIDTITLNKILKNDISEYNYLILAYLGQTSNNINSFEDFKLDDKNITCKRYAKYCNGRKLPVFEDCHFRETLLKEKGFVLVKKITKYKKSMLIYKNIEKSY